MNEVLKTIKARRSIRAYKPEQITAQELDLILEAAIYAPTGCNTQPWYFTVIQNRAIIEHINKISKEVMAASDDEWLRDKGLKQGFDITYKAPTLVVVSGRTDAVTWKSDCDAAIQNMLLAAESLHIGSLWLTFVTYCFQKAGEAEKIGVPAGYQPMYGVALGYKAQPEQPAVPARNVDVVNYIR